MKPLNTWKKTMLPAALALALIVPAAAYAADQSNGSDSGSGAAPTTESSAPAQTPKQDRFMGGGKGRHGGPGGMDMRGGKQMAGKQAAGIKVDGHINQNKYMELLAEKYASDTLNDWKTAQTEQSSLGQQLNDLLGDAGVRSALKAQREAQMEQMKAQRDELKSKLESGEITKEQLKEQLGADGGKLGHGFKGGPGGLWGVLNGSAAGGDATAIQDEHTHRKELTQAIKADDADAIKAALAKLLDDLKTNNAKLSAKIAELKQSANGQPAAQAKPQARVLPQTDKNSQQATQSSAQTSSLKLNTSGGTITSI